MFFHTLHTDKDVHQNEFFRGSLNGDFARTAYHRHCIWTVFRQYALVRDSSDKQLRKWKQTFYAYPLFL